VVVVSGLVVVLGGRVDRRRVRAIRLDVVGGALASGRWSMIPALSTAGNRLSTNRIASNAGLSANTAAAGCS